MGFVGIFIENDGRFNDGDERNIDEGVFEIVVVYIRRNSSWRKMKKRREGWEDDGG